MRHANEIMESMYTPLGLVLNKASFIFPYIYLCVFIIYDYIISFSIFLIRSIMVLWFISKDLIFYMNG